MFAVLLTDKMDGFYAIVTSFPTVIFTVMLLVSIFYWLISFLGVIDFDALDVDAAADSAGDGTGINGIAGLAMKLGLNGVPLPIIVSLISGIGWLFSYYSVYFLAKLLPVALMYLVGILIFSAALYLATLLTAQIIKPLRKLFKQADQFIEHNIVGQVAIVRTGRVDQKFGEASVADGGAGLVVKVRAYKDEVFKRGDRVVLLEYVNSENHYKIIAESEFTE